MVSDISPGVYSGEPSKLQAAFDKVVRGLASQGWTQSLGTTGMCCYRGRDDRRCALGHLIRDDEYTPAMEGCVPADCTRTTDGQLWPGADVLKAVLEREGLSIDDASSLQRCHDDSPWPRYMFDAVHRWGERHDLVFPAGVKRPE